MTHCPCIVFLEMKQELNLCLKLSVCQFTFTLILSDGHEV